MRWFRGLRGLYFVCLFIVKFHSSGCYLVVHVSPESKHLLTPIEETHPLFLIAFKDNPFLSVLLSTFLDFILF